jgi:ParB family chromosome partitioning protein
MAKLSPPSTAGFNAASYSVKLVRVDDIKIDPKISGIFKVSDKIKNEIVQQIKLFDFDKSQPLTLEKGTNVLLDGHTRLAAAKEAGLVEVPVIEKEFENREAAILYTFERQVIRRNLTSAEILTAAQMIKGRKEADGTGRAAEILAEKLGISPATVYQARAILKDASPEDLKAVKKGEASIKAVYNRTKQRQRPETEFAVNDAQGLPGNIAFLKSAVVLLAEQEQLPAADMLIKHFLKKNEKAGFYKLLPLKISRQLPKLPLLSRTSN